MNNSKKTYDLLIIGAGPIGLACGIEAHKKGLSYLILDKGVLTNSLYHYPDNMTFFSTSDKLEIGGVPFISHNVKPTRNEALEYYRRVTDSWKLNVNLYEPVVSIQREDNIFRIQTSKNGYTARNVIVSTGFYDLPYKLNVPGEDLPNVLHYYKGPHPFFRAKVAVIGAANSAVDAALECYRGGAAEVTMIIRGSSLSDSVKYWVKPDVENRIKEGSIQAFFNTEVKAISETTLTIENSSGLITLPNDFVLAMTGYQPDFSFLTRAGVEIDREDPYLTPVHNPETMETNVPGLFLAGVICGGLKTNKWFIENSRVHAEIITDEISNKSISA